MPLAGRIEVFLTVHSTGELFIVPWGHTNKPYHRIKPLEKLLEMGR